jgi:hypothetical protein
MDFGGVHSVSHSPDFETDIRQFGFGAEKFPSNFASALSSLKKIAPEQTPVKDDELAETPPYVTAKPDVTYRKLTRGSKEGDIRFIVMATDGRKSDGRLTVCRLEPCS